MSATGKTPSMQALQNMLQAIQESMAKNQESTSKNFEDLGADVKAEMRGVKEEIKQMRSELGDIRQTLIQQEEKMKEIEKKTEKCEGRMDSWEKRQITINRGLEEEIIFLEMERSSFFLRIQNVAEEKGEKLDDIVGEIVAETLEADRLMIQRDIDEAFRVFTSYAKRNNLPREIHVRFNKKALCEEFYKRTRDQTITYKGQPMIVLKQIPRRVREQRRRYQFLTTFLRKNAISYRWLLPEGLLMTWRDKKVRIRSLQEAREFMEQQFNLSELDVEGEGESRSLEESQEEEEVEERREGKTGKKGGGIRKVEELTAPQRETRQTVKKAITAGK